MTTLTVIVDVVDTHQKEQTKKALLVLSNDPDDVSIWVGGSLDGSCGRVSLTLEIPDQKVKARIKEVACYLLEKLDNAPVKLAIVAQKEKYT